MISDIAAKSQRSRLLTEYENDVVIGLFPPSCESLSTAVVQLLVTDPPHHEHWRKVICGVACFVKHHQLQTFFIHVYDIQGFELIWQQEVYIELDYRARPTSRGIQAVHVFHTFEADNCMAGLSFADEAEANDFYDKVSSKTLMQRRKTVRQTRRVTGQNGLQRENATKPHRPAPQIPVNIPAPNVSDNAAFRMTAAQGVSTGHSQPVPQTADKQTNGFSLSGLFGKKEKASKNAAKKLTAADIGRPLAETFKHVAHCGWDAEAGRLDYDANNPMVAQLFATAGINTSEIDKDTAEFIYATLDNLGGMKAIEEAATSSTRAPPPPRPTSAPTRRTDIRPPPSRVPPALNLTPDQNRIRSDSAELKQPPSIRNLIPPPPPRRTGSVTDVTQTPAHRELSMPTGPAPQPPRLRGDSGRLGGPMPPPPPPMPPAGFAPPPAPPPPPVSSGADFPPPPPDLLRGDSIRSTASGDGRSALLSEIRQGTALKPVTRDNSDPGPASTRDKLMNQIRDGRQLRVVTPEDKAPKDSTLQLEGMAAALQVAMERRRNAMQQERDEDESDYDDDDEEWEC